MADPIIFGFPVSTYVRTARTVLEEKGVAYRLEPLPPHDDALKGRHPWGKIPAFEHDGLRLFETLAIATYAEDTFGGTRLFRVEAKARARMFQWASAIADDVYPRLIVRLVIPYVVARGSDSGPDRSIIDGAMPENRHALGVLDGALADSPCLSGDTVAYDDLLLAPIIYWVGKMPEGPDLLKPVANVRRWFDAISERPAFKATEPEMPPS